MLGNTNWVAALSRWETWSVIAGNLLPLLGIFYLGWDASTLIILYWMETAVVGFWLIVRLLAARDESLPDTLTKPKTGLPVDGGALAVFLTFHAGVFMAIHLVFLTSLAPGEWNRHMSSPIDFVQNFVIPSGLWIPLAGLFVARGVVTIGEIRAHQPVAHLIAGFYARIVLMQFVIVFGGFITFTLGSPLVLLVLIVAFKIIAEIGWTSFGPKLEAAFSRPSRKTPG